MTVYHAKYLAHELTKRCASHSVEKLATALSNAQVDLNGMRKHGAGLVAYRAHSMRQMMKRRLLDAGLPQLFSPHSFRFTVVTDLLNQNVPLEDVQYLAGHSNPRTTQIYDRRRRVTRNIAAGYLRSRASSSRRFVA